MVNIYLLPRDERFQEQIESLRSAVISDIRAAGIDVDPGVEWAPEIPLCTVQDVGDASLLCVGEVIATRIKGWERPVVFLPRGFVLAGEGASRRVCLGVKMTESATNMTRWAVMVAAKHAGMMRIDEPLLHIVDVPAKLPRAFGEIMITGKPATQCRGWDLLIKRGTERVYSSQASSICIGSDRK